MTSNIATRLFPSLTVRRFGDAYCPITRSNISDGCFIIASKLAQRAALRSQALLAILSLNSPRADDEGPARVVVSDRRNTARR